MRRSNWPQNCIQVVPLQIAQVQVSTERLEISGMDSKDSSPKAVLPKLCLRNLPAVAPQPQGRLRPLRRRPGSVIILIFLN